MQRFVCIHGHFYQPPRENPWLETIELQDSAYPYHDWNERVFAECYAPNGASRILDSDSHIAQIVNNYCRMSFNFGPTLLSWMEEKAPQTYREVIAADGESQTRFSGHGSAIAQAYNHLILPLANKRDQLTQVVWGITDFRKRFGRNPEGMWLPETAVDMESLEALAEQSIAFTILAPHQGARVRRLGEHQWQDVIGGRIDPTMPYYVSLPSGRRIAVFFYDGPISRAVAFERLLSSGATFVHRLASGFSDDRGRDQLMHIATDGETYGHHHRFGDMALAWAFDHIEKNKLAKITNYGEYLESHPPTHEAEIIEDTSWSCNHGLERWRSDCGCCSGGNPTWHQRWRAPLRAALDDLRDTLVTIFDEKAQEYLSSPWTARDDYISVILDRSRDNVESFFHRHARRALTDQDKTNILKLMEMQRHALLMYTSCGWFFDDLAGIETVQILEYAERALQLAQDFTPEPLEPRFVASLAMASSNDSAFSSGDDVYRQRVKPATADLNKVAAHYALSSLFANFEEKTISSFSVQRLDYRTATAGRARLAMGQLLVSSDVTWESTVLCFCALHLGDHNLSGGVRLKIGDDACHEMVIDINDAFKRSDVPGLIRLIDRYFKTNYSLCDLFRDEQRRILTTIVDSALEEAMSFYGKLHEDQMPLMRFLADLQAPLPRALQATADLVLNRELRREFSTPTLNREKVHLLLDEAQRFKVELDAPGLAFALSRLLADLACQVEANPSQLASLQELTGAVGLAVSLPFEMDLWPVQNMYFRLPRAVIKATHQAAVEGHGNARAWLTCLAVLGELLRVRPPFELFQADWA